MELILGAAVAALGLAFGSFATVLVARVPEGRNFAQGRSGCPKCGTAIAAYDNIPVVSWVLLRGKCRHCKEPIAAIYPLIELAVATLVLATYLIWGVSWTSLLLTYLAIVTVALFVIDLKHRRLPHSLVLPSYPVVIVLMAIAWLTGESNSWWSALIGLLSLGGLYGLLWFFYPKGMGFGDVTTAGLLGLVLGYLGLESVAVGGISGPLIGGLVVIVLVLAKRVGRSSAIPYGPALISGAWLGIFAGPSIADAYLALVGIK